MLNTIGIEVELLLDGKLGTDIPRQFAMQYGEEEWGIAQVDINILKTTLDNSQEYWDAWDRVLEEAEFIDVDNVKWHLEQDDDNTLYTLMEGESLYDDDMEDEDDDNEDVSKNEYASEKS